MLAFSRDLGIFDGNDSAVQTSVGSALVLFSRDLLYLRSVFVCNLILRRLQAAQLLDQVVLGTGGTFIFTFFEFECLQDLLLLLAYPVVLHQDVVLVYFLQDDALFG